MKQQLEKLGFYEYEDKYENICYELVFYNMDYKIDVKYGNVYLNDYSNYTRLFPYNYEKLKQLIQILL